MKKKIISIVLAISALATSVSAANLYDFINSREGWQPIQAIKDGLDENGTYVFPTAVTTAVTAQVKKTGAADSAYANKATATAVTDKFDYKVELDMTAVKTAFKNLHTAAKAAIDASQNIEPTPAPTGEPGESVSLNDQLKNYFDASEVTGTFTVNVKYDKNLTFNTGAFTLEQAGVTSPIFTLTNVSTPTTADAASNQIDVTFTVNAGVKISDLYAKIDAADSQLNNLTVKLPAVGLPGVLNKNQVLDVTAQMTSGTVLIDDHTGRKVDTDSKTQYGKINFNSDSSKASVTYAPTSSGSSSSGSSKRPIITPANAPKVKSSADGVLKNENIYANNGKYFLNVDRVSAPSKPNFAFEGWYTDPYFSNHVSGTIQVEEDLTLYARYINLKAPEQLISEEHIAYIAGYPDGTIQPNGNITREEVAAAFYRLFKTDYRATIESDVNSFADVAADRWSNKAVSTMANGGFIVGDTNGNFNPANPITRAEFVTIANKFIGSDVTVPETNQFTDISGHWAEKAILAAANGAYWISGYSDGTFRPNAYITRAEAMTIINKMLVRYGDADATNATVWPDVAKGDWFYSQIIEATTTNEYERLGNGWQEKWVSPEAPKADEKTDETTGDETQAPAEEATGEGANEKAENTETAENTENTENTDNTETAPKTEADDGSTPEK